MRKTFLHSGKVLAFGLGLVATVAITPQTASALDMFFAGPKALGMAGSRTASVDDTTAMYYNPAALGFFGMRDEAGKRLDCDNNDCGRKDWGADLDAGVGYRLHDEFGSYLNTLVDVDLDAVENGIDNESELRDLVNIAGSLSGIDDEGNAITVDVNAGLGMRYGHFAIGSRAFLQASGKVANIDSENLGIETSIPGELTADINNVNLTGFDSNYQRQVFSESQADRIEAVLISKGATAADAEEAVKKLDFLARDQGLEAGNIGQTVDLLVGAAESSGEGLDKNTTTVALTGFGLLEVPISYGYAINKHWSVGATVKYMQGRVYGTQIFVFDDDSEEVLKEINEDYEESANFGVDLGIMGRYKYVQFGLLGRNLNAPEFDGFTHTTTLSNGQQKIQEVDDVQIDPQVRAGVAFIPFPTLVIEADLDLTKNETTLKGYDTQYASIGLEWDAFRVLALRAGAYKNIAEDDIDVVYTAGLGLNLWAARLDLAGAFSTETEEFDGDDLPQEIRVAAALSVDF